MLGHDHIVRSREKSAAEDCPPVSPFGARRRGSYPSRLVLDNGPECTSKALVLWACERGVDLAFIRPGKPIENCFVESTRLN